MTWSVIDSPSGVHTLPDDDCAIHEVSLACPCIPQRTMVDGCGVDVAIPLPGGMHKHVLYQRVRLMLTHSAWDGRAQ